jgi:hypothetical protein
VKKATPKINFSVNSVEVAFDSSQRGSWPRKVRLLAPDPIWLWGVTTLGICRFRGVTALPLTNFVTALGFCHYYFW